MSDTDADAGDSPVRYELRCSLCQQTRPTRSYRALPVCVNCWRKRRAIWDMRQAVRRRKEQRA